MQLDNRDPRPVMSEQGQPNFVGPNHQAIQNRVKPKRMKQPFNLKFLTSTLVILIGALIILIVVALLFYKTTSETNYVNTSTYQLVDININVAGGQIYYGKIVRMNSSFVVLDNVFYIQPASSGTNQYLTSLTCTLYDPQDQIVINRSQIAFWENLSSKSQVVTDIQKWQTDKLQCSKTSTADTTSTTPATTTGTTTDATTTK
jgi:hypothetical protein